MMDAAYREALKIIPWGTQTHAKRLIPELEGVQPSFIESAEGCRIRDTRGRSFIDYRCSLGPVILGHRHPAVEMAVQLQLQKGVLFSMASPLEASVAREIQRRIPMAERVRFLKTGADANAACVRLARAYTRRDKIVITAYHGWHDAFLPDQPGVPRAVRALSLSCPYGNTSALEKIFAKHGRSIAAMLTVPYDWREKADGEFLRAARRLTKKHKCVLILDEVLTGFRLAPGGGQEYFGVEGDLVTYAKAIANGYPLSVFAGKARIMALLEKTRITTTTAGETLSLAACRATLATMADGGVQKRIWETGRKLMEGLSYLFSEHAIPHTFRGLPPVFTTVLGPSEEKENKALRTRFLAGLFHRGIFTDGLWILSAAHGDAEIQETLTAAEAALTDATR